jgi:hypothetical protein
MKRMTFSLMLLLASFTSLQAAEKGKQLKILMIGNSYTGQSWRQLEGFLKADAKANATIKTHTPGGRQIHQHVKNPKVQAMIKGKDKWDVIVLQDQSQVPAFAFSDAFKGRQSALSSITQGGPKMLALIKEHQPKAKVFLFETWARHKDPDKFKTLENFKGDPKEMQEALCKGYAYMLKHDADDGWDYTKVATIAPVGRAWAAWYAAKGYKDGATKLHKGDNSHPGKLGAYLTGAIFYEMITGKDVVKAAYTAKIPKTLAAELRQTAHDTIRKAAEGM